VTDGRCDFEEAIAFRFCSYVMLKYHGLIGCERICFPRCGQGCKFKG
jgi:hypothetical protein